MRMLGSHKKGCMRGVCCDYKLLLLCFVERISKVMGGGECGKIENKGRLERYRDKMNTVRVEIRGSE